MAIFDIFEEVSEKTVTKTETGDNRILGVVVGEVVHTYSPTMPGRVCVSIHVRDSEANVLKWARMAFASFGSDWGSYFLPEIGDQVLVVFDQGLIDRPFIIGCIAKDTSKFLKKTADVTNKYKKITTKHGSTITFTDEPAGEGSLDSIEIMTANEAHKIIMDNQKKKIIIQDKEKNASVEMNTATGNISINAAHKLSIRVGETISVDMSGDTGNIVISANKIKASATADVKLEGGGKMNLSGATVSADAQGMMSLSAAGIVKVEGKPIKLG